MLAVKMLGRQCRYMHVIVCRQFAVTLHRNGKCTSRGVGTVPNHCAHLSLEGVENSVVDLPAHTHDMTVTVTVKLVRKGGGGQLHSVHAAQGDRGSIYLSDGYTNPP
jgi:hypothetical protein